MKSPIIEFENYSYKYKFRKNWAIESISFKIYAGETVIITGPSGIGKSTLLYSIIGLIPHFYSGKMRGKVYIKGKSTEKQTIQQIVKFIGYVPQRIDNYIISNTVYSELSFSLRYRRYSPDEIKKRITEIGKQLNILHLLKQDPHKLSDGERHKVCIGSVLVSHPEVLVIDEPLSNLDKRAKDNVLDILKKMKEDTHTIIIAAHNIEDYKELSPKIIEVSAHNFNFNREFKKEKKNDIYKKSSRIRTNSTINVQLYNLNFKYSNKENSFKFENINETFSGGEVIGITGRNGSGKTTLIKLIAGILKPKKGTILINNEPIDKLGSYRLSKTMGIVLPNPELQFFEESVIDEITLVSRNINNKVRDEEVMKLLDESKLLGVKTASPFSLSEGQKKRLAYIAATTHNPKIILLDEVTNGMDINNKIWLKQQIVKERDKGKLILIASHDNKFLLSVADRIIEIDNAKIKDLTELK